MPLQRGQGIVARAVTVVLTGDKKLNRRLKKLAGKDAKKAVRKSLRPALKPIHQQAKANARQFKKTGKLGRSIKIRSIKRTRKGFGARVTTGTATTDFSGETYYGAFHEYGWKTGKRGSSNRRQIEGKKFMQNAVDQKRRIAMKIYRNEIKRNIEAIAKGG